MTKRKEKTFREKLKQAKVSLFESTPKYDPMTIYLTERERKAIVEAEKKGGGTKNRLIPALCQLLVNERDNEEG